MSRAKSKPMTAKDFVNAAEFGDDISVKRGLEQNPPIDIHAKLQDGDTALHCAVENKRASTVSLLLANPPPNAADVDERDADDRTALLVAASNNVGSPIIEELLAHKADITAIDTNGRTALHWVIARTGAADKYKTEAESIGSLRFWLDRGAHRLLDTADKHGFTPAARADQKQLTTVASFLRTYQYTPPAPNKPERAAPMLSKLLGEQKNVSDSTGPRRSVSSSPLTQPRHLQPAPAAPQAQSPPAQLQPSLASPLQPPSCNVPSHAQLQSERDEARKQMEQRDAAHERTLLLAEAKRDETRRERDAAHKARDDALRERDSALAALAALTKAHRELSEKTEHKKSKVANYNGVREDDIIFDEGKDKLGDGMGGMVFRARFNGADVAAKFIKDSSAVEYEFERELSMMTAFPPHPNVVGFLGASSAKPFILMMTLMRGSLEQILMQDKEFVLDFGRAKTDAAVARQTLLNLQRVVWFLVGASAGVMHLHANRVVHGDVAARNLLVDYNLNCCVCDFGLSQVLPAGEISVTTGADINLPIAWCAPETLQKHAWSEKTDVYSFGITVVEVLARREPYPGLDLIKEVGPGVCKKEPHTLRPRMEDWWPTELTTLVANCCDAQPADRLNMSSVNKVLRRYHKRLCDAAKLGDVYHFEGLNSPEAVAAASASASASYKCIQASHYYLTPNSAVL